MADYRFPGEHMYKNLVLTKLQTDRNIELVKELSVVDGDVIIATYNKTGTTWMQELVWLITHEGDQSEALTTTLIHRMPFLEHSTSYDNGKAGIDFLETHKRPCIMKTHLPAWIYEKQLAENRLKFIIVIRNPKDTLVSLYHFYCMNANFGNFPGSWDDFFELYKTKHLVRGDFFDWYSSWIPYLDRPNIQMYTYEDLTYNFDAVFTRLCEFLGKKIPEDKIPIIKEHVSFQKMKENPMVNNTENPNMQQNVSAFIRKGKVGNWKNYFSAEQNAQVDARYEETLASKGIQLCFE